jgi:hypothetical protein
MLDITDQADLKAWSWNVWESDSSSESLIFLGIVILKTDLEFNGFLELPLLLVLHDGVDSLGDLGLS